MVAARGVAATEGIHREATLREQVARALRASLFSGQIAPGQTFSVPALAEEFGVSATPVREAVLDLVQHGLVVPVPSKGFRVVDPSPTTIAQTIEIRRLLEVPTTLRIAESITMDQIAPLREMAAEILRHAELEDVPGFVGVDYEFHRSLLALSGNDMLVDLVEDLRSRGRIHTVPHAAAAGRLAEFAQEHVALLDAMAERDLPAVERITLAHMERAIGTPPQPPGSAQRRVPTRSRTAT